MLGTFPTTITVTFRILPCFIFDIYAIRFICLKYLFDSQSHFTFLGFDASQPLARAKSDHRNVKQPEMKQSRVKISVLVACFANAQSSPLRDRNEDSDTDTSLMGRVIGAGHDTGEHEYPYSATP
jgi:hypothetical protein